jgi:hypothetical protein
MIATACTIKTIIEDPLLPILKKDSSITKPTGQIRRPGLDYNPTSPRFKLFMIDFIPYPKISVFFNVRLYSRRPLRLFLRKKSIHSFFSLRKYIPFVFFPQGGPGASFVIFPPPASPVDPIALIRILQNQVNEITNHFFSDLGLNIGKSAMHHAGCMAALNLAWFRANSLPAPPSVGTGASRRI